MSFVRSLWLLLLLLSGVLCSEESIFEPLFAEDLTLNNFEAKLSSLTKSGFGPSSVSAYSYVLVDFYVTWCGSCQRFAPDFERLAELFNMNDVPIWALRVNCVDEGELCKKFDIAGYPTIKWGKRESFLQAFQGTDSSGVVNVQTAFRSAEAITDWINTKLHKNYILTIPKLYEEEKEKMHQLRQQAKTQAAATTIEPHSEPDVPPSPSFTDSRASLWDAEKAIYMVVDYIFETQVLDIHKRSVFFDFLDLLCAHFPTKSCKPSLCYFSSKMRQIWTPEATSVPLDVVKSSWNLCGKDGDTYHKGSWHACKGSSPDLRGFPCGLWILFHTLLVQIPDTLHGADVVDNVLKIKAFIATFFHCSDCREHFLAMSKNIVNEINSKKEAVLWFWQAHNKVNRRLKETGGSFDDPNFPKIQWPPKELCPQCRTLGGTGGDDGVVDWNDGAVYDFLVRYYRGEGEESDERQRLEDDEELRPRDAGYFGMKVLLCIMMIPVGVFGWYYYRFGLTKQQGLLPTRAWKPLNKK